MLVADRASLDKILHIFRQGGPPKMLEENIPCVLGPWVAGELLGVCPLQDNTTASKENNKPPVAGLFVDEL